jgi:hypothetical protein
MRSGNGDMLWDIIGGDRTWRLSTCLFSSLRRSDRHERGVMTGLHLERPARRTLLVAIVSFQSDNSDGDGVDDVDEV